MSKRIIGERSLGISQNFRRVQNELFLRIRTNEETQPRETHAIHDPYDTSAASVHQTQSQSVQGFDQQNQRVKHSYRSKPDVDISAFVPLNASAIGGPSPPTECGHMIRRPIQDALPREHGDQVCRNKVKHVGSHHCKAPPTGHCTELTRVGNIRRRP